jgi:hypothetical protein
MMHVCKALANDREPTLENLEVFTTVDSVPPEHELLFFSFMPLSVLVTRIGRRIENIEINWMGLRRIAYRFNHFWCTLHTSE